MLESVVRIIAQQDAHDASDDSEDTRFELEMLAGRLGDGRSARHEEACDADHEQPAANFLLDAFGGLYVQLPLCGVVALHRSVELLGQPPQMVSRTHHEARLPPSAAAG